MVIGRGRRRRERRGSKRSQVLVCSSGGVGNCGDDAILLRTVERIASTVSGASVDVLTDEDHPIALLGGARRVGLVREWEKVDLAAYGLVVVAGGGFACDWFGAHLEPRLGVAARARDAGVLVLVTGQGVGPLTDPTKIADLRALAEIADAFSVRDPVSRDLLAGLGIAATLTGDDALGLQGSRPPRSLPARYVALHLRNASYQTADAEILDHWARVTEEYADACGCDVVGIAVNDRAEAPEAETLRAAGVEHVIDATRDPRALVAVVSDATAVVAHSYHVALFALAAGVPALLSSAGDYYAAKGEGLRQLAGLTDALVAPAPPTSPAVHERIDATRAVLAGNDALARATRQVDAFLSARSAR